MRFVVVDSYLVATMFMDDLFLMSGSEEDMQMLNFIVTEFHDFQGSAMAAHKCVGGSSVPRERCFVDFENGGWTTARLFDEIREWCTLRGSTLSNRGVDQPRYEFCDGGIRVWVSQKELELLVVRRIACAPAIILVQRYQNTPCLAGTKADPRKSIPVARRGRSSNAHITTRFAGERQKHDQSFKCLD